MEEKRFKSLFDEKYRDLKKRAELCADLVPPKEILALVNEDVRNNEGVRGLGWLPWVGTNYFAGGMTNKVLLVAESHYRKLNPEEPEKENRNWDYLDYSCVRLAETVFNTDLNKKSGKNDNLTYENLFETINPFSPQGMCLNSNPTPEELEKNSKVKQQVFSNIVFMNMCQRCLGSSTKRPGEMDLSNGWRIWFEVAKVYKPTLCVFDGFLYADFLSAGNLQKAVRKLQTVVPGTIRVEIDECVKKDAAVYETKKKIRVRRARIRIDDHPIELVWLMHTSLDKRYGMTFVPGDWRGYLDSCPPFVGWVNEMKAKIPLPMH